MWRLIRIERTKTVRRVGRRGLLLILGGLAWVLIGLDVTRHRVPRFVSPHPVPRSNSILVVMNDHRWGWAWILFGTVAFLSGVLRRYPLIRRHDSVGFNALLTPPFLWMLYFIWSGVVYLASDGQQGQDGQSFYGVVVWFLVNLFIITCAGWPETTESIVVGRPNDEDTAP